MTAPRRLCAMFALLLLLTLPAARAAGPPWKEYAEKPDDWYRGAEGTRIAANVRSHQSDEGAWPKNGDTASAPSDKEPKRIKGTFDNGATFDELRFLARAFRATHDEADRAALLKGLDLVLHAQYPSGGWPQSAPPSRTGYDRHITLNDGTMVHILEFLRDVARSDAFAFVDDARRQSSRKAFDAGIACLLKAQVLVKGEPTVWCAQHDEVTLEPRPARKFEPVSLSGGESAEVLMLLMSLDHPDAAVRRAVEAGVRWYEASKLTGIREVRTKGDKIIVPDPDAPPLWARFYEIGTNRPLFSGRDSVIKYSLAEIEKERRGGYSWYGTWGAKVLAAYPKWKAR